MAGTPTTNYSIPTYADTDAPDLSGAYNDAMDIIDTQLKANADAIESASTGNYTGTAPITVDNEERVIGINTVSLDSTGEQIGAGIPTVTGKASAISTETPLNVAVVPNSRAVADYVAAHGGTAYKGTAPINVTGDTISVATATPNENGGSGPLGVVQVTSSETAISDTGSGDVRSPRVPNIYAVKKYVESAMAAAGAAYTGTAPIVVDNGEHTISINNAGFPSGQSGAWVAGTQGVVSISGNADATKYFAEKSTVEGPDKLAAARSVPNSYAVVELLRQGTPDASTTVKGLVQLTTSPASADSTMAVTGSGVVRLLSDRKTNATTNVTVDMLKNLYVDTITGVVYYKAQGV